MLSSEGCTGRVTSPGEFLLDDYTSDVPVCPGVYNLILHLKVIATRELKGASQQHDITDCVVTVRIEGVGKSKFLC